MRGDQSPKKQEFFQHIKDYFSQGRFYFGVADIFAVVVSTLRPARAISFSFSRWPWAKTKSGSLKNL